MLQRGRPVVSIYDMARLLVQVTYPWSELPSVRDRCRQEYVVHIVGKQDDGFLPHNAALFISHVVDFVEYDPGDFAHHLRAAVQHAPQDLRNENAR